MPKFPSEEDLWGLSEEVKEFITFVVTNMDRPTNRSCCCARWTVPTRNDVSGSMRAPCAFIAST